MTKFYVNEKGFELEIGKKIVQVRKDGDLIARWDRKSPLFKFNDEVEELSRMERMRRQCPICGSIGSNDN